MRGVKGIEDLGVFRVLGQPNLNVTVDRQPGRPLPNQRRRRTGRDPDRRGRNALTQVLQGEARYDLVMRYLPHTVTPGKRSRTFARSHPPAYEFRLRNSARLKEAGHPRSIARVTSGTSPSSKWTAVT